MNYIAIVSLLKSKTGDTTQAEPELKVHQIMPVGNDSSATGHTRTFAQNDLKQQYGDSFVGFVPETELPGNWKVGTVALVKTTESNILKVVTITSRLDRGWITNSETSTVEYLGYYTFSNVTLPTIQEEINSMQGYINDLELENASLLEAAESTDDHVKSLSCRVSMLEYENKQLCDTMSETEELLTESRKVAAVRSDDCKRLLSELEKMRRTADDDLSSMQGLHLEISDLKKKLSEQYREIANLREDAKYAVRTGSTPVRVSSTGNPVYTEAVSLIKNFDIKTLLTREERDLKLSKLNKLKAVAEACDEDFDAECIPPPWARLK